MNLLTKKTKMMFKMITAKCPVCGKEHTAPVYQCTSYYLDGTPQSTLNEWLSRYVICDCGLIYSVVNPDTISPSRAQAYAEALAQSYSDEEKRKLELLRATTDKRLSWLDAKYYRERGDQEMLHKCLTSMVNNLTHYGITMGHGSLPQIHLTSQFIFTEQYERIDLLRQLGRFNEAKQYINVLRAAKYYSEPHELWDFLQLEERLMQKRDTRQH